VLTHFVRKSVSSKSFLSGNPEAFPEDFPISSVTDPTVSVYAVGKGRIASKREGSL
jgi:hypothetical protein